MPIDSSYLMILYFKQKKFNKIKNTLSKDATVINTCYPFTSKNIVFK